MMRKFLIAVALLFMIIPDVFSQKDPEAVKVLDSFSAKALAAPSISMKFNIITNDQTEGTSNSVPGSIILLKDRYRLDLTDNIVWSNGETMWNYLPSEKEVTVNRADKKDNSFQSKPSSVFSIYKKGYKIRMVDSNSASWVIDLYPEDINTDYIRIRLNIGKAAYNLKNIDYKYKNGITVTLDVTEFNLSQKPDGSTFIFPSEKYKGVEIIDMR